LISDYVERVLVSYLKVMTHMGTKLVDKKSLTRYIVNAVEKKNENKASCKLS